MFRKHTENVRRLLPSVNRESADVALVGLVIGKSDCIQAALLVVE